MFTLAAPYDIQTNTATKTRHTIVIRSYLKGIVSLVGEATIPISTIIDVVNSCAATVCRALSAICQIDTLKLSMWKHKELATSRAVDNAAVT